MASIASLHTDLATQTQHRAWIAASAVFVILAALAVITCSCLCFMQPGINVISNVCYRILPCIAAIVIALPFLLRTMGNNQVRTDLIDSIREELVASAPSSNETQLKRQALQFLPQTASLLYSSQLLADVKKTFPKEETARTPDEKKIVEALDKAVKHLHQEASGAEPDED